MARRENARARGGLAVFAIGVACGGLLVSQLESPVVSGEEPKIADEEGAPLVPQLQDLYDDISEIVFRHYPEAASREDGNSFRFEFATRKFMIHHPLLTGEWQTASEELGPTPSGMMLQISLQSGRWSGQAGVPQSFDQCYYTVHLMAPYSKATDRHLVVQLKLPRRHSDGPFLKEVRDRINQFGPHSWGEGE